MLPDNVTIASHLAFRSAPTGAIRSKTIVLLTPEEIDQAAKQQLNSGLREAETQLFAEVFAQNDRNCGTTFLPLHSGHLIFFFSCSAMVSVTVKFLSQFLQKYS